MVAWLTRVFGPAHLELAEEVVQDVFARLWRHAGDYDPGKAIA